MLVGASNSGADSNVSMSRLRARRFHRVRGVGQDDSGFESGQSGVVDTSSIYGDQAISAISNAGSYGSLTSTGVPSTTNTSTLSSSSAWTSIANMFSSLGNAATKAFASTQTQCSVGTTLVGNQCLPTTAVNSLALQSATSLTTSSLMSYAPLLIGLVVVVMVMNASKGH
jgi:hypothetical protein